jgi:hypothetical protein
MILQTVDIVLAFSLIMLLLSMMVTVVVQMAISLSGLRGRNMLWGVGHLVATIAPELSSSEAEKLAQKVVGHASLAVPSLPFWKHRLPRPPIKIEAKELLLVLDRIRKSGELVTTTQQVVDDLFTGDAGEGSELARSLRLLESVEAVAPEQAEALREAAERGLDQAKRIVVEVHDWFDGAMDRAAERFKLHTRWWTIFVAVVLAYGLGVDSIDVFAQLRANPQIATRIAMQSEDVTALYDEAQAALAETEESPGDVPRRGGGNAPPRSDVAASNVTPPADDTQEALVKRLEKLAGVQSDLRCQLLDLDLTIFRNLREPQIAGAGAACDAQEKTADASGSIPDPAEARGGHFFGQLMTVLLLSLGGPFWYGLIGKMVGFRSLAGDRKKASR